MDQAEDPRERLEALARDYDQWLTELTPRGDGSVDKGEKPLEQLLEISGTLHRIHDRDRLLAYVSERLREFFDAQNSFVILFEENGEPRILESNLSRDALAGPLLSSTVLERVRRSKAPVVVSDTSLDPALSGRSSIEHLKIASGLCAPLIVEGEVIGVLQFDHRGEIHGFPTSDARLLQLFANQVATAVHNLQLIEKRDEALAVMRRAEERLIQSERLSAIGRLAAGVAHDFNNTLFIVLGQCDVLLARAGLPRNVESTIERIQSCALDASKTVRRLQSLGPDISRVMPKETVALDQLAQELPELTRRKWRDEALERGISVEVQVLANPVPEVCADPAELREILTNLIFNAVEAMDSDGVIRLETSFSEGLVLATVTDQGRGMSEEDCARVFEPFFSSKSGRGHGFGLSTCWSLAEAMGGSLDVKSKPSLGSTFTLRLPAARACSPIREPESFIAPRTLAILVVDDDVDVRETLSRMLRASGHRVEGCDSAARGLERVAAQEFELVITDMSMPGQSGADLAARLQIEHPRLPVVLITGFGAGDTSQLSANVRSVLPKPIRLRALSEAVLAAVLKTS